MGRRLATTRAARVPAASLAALLLVSSGGLLAGCGSSTPADDAPRLASLLQQVDRDLSAEDYVAARSDLHALLRATTRARDEGDLAPDEAARILAAAAAVLSRVPGSRSTPTPATEPSGVPDDDVEPEVDEPDPETRGTGKGKGKGKGGSKRNGKGGTNGGGKGKG